MGEGVGKDEDEDRGEGEGESQGEGGGVGEHLAPDMNPTCQCTQPHNLLIPQG